jgi:hypothetical protein
MLIFIKGNGPTLVHRPDVSAAPTTCGLTCSSGVGAASEKVITQTTLTRQTPVITLTVLPIAGLDSTPTAEVAHPDVGHPDRASAR